MPGGQRRNRAARRYSCDDGDRELSPQWAPCLPFYSNIFYKSSIAFQVANGLGYEPRCAPKRFGHAQYRDSRRRVAVLSKVTRLGNLQYAARPKYAIDLVQLCVLE